MKNDKKWKSGKVSEIYKAGLSTTRWSKLIRRDSHLYNLLDFYSDHCCIWLSGQTTNTSSGATAVNPLFRNAMYTIAFGGVEGPVRSE